MCLHNFKVTLGKSGLQADLQKILLLIAMGSGNKILNGCDVGPARRPSSWKIVPVTDCGAASATASRVRQTGARAYQHAMSPDWCWSSGALKRIMYAFGG
jgi:hypothetical protein